ncbi:hypothetical protein CCACVL1_29562 [Corchorus capsularis]|uniref:Aminotransferase-like plant mobile domain-containing protein n=1 Tax=Corchorus capsularis TaxID=210143 RepID=A0A1R3G190_COCAP|nr:hypothetical protein CCACVL1_29562 [Corchorus capsularis]
MVLLLHILGDLDPRIVQLDADEQAIETSLVAAHSTIAAGKKFNDAKTTKLFDWLQYYGKPDSDIALLHRRAALVLLWLSKFVFGGFLGDRVLIELLDTFFDDEMEGRGCFLIETAVSYPLLQVFLYEHYTEFAVPFNTPREIDVPHSYEWSGEGNEYVSVMTPAMIEYWEKFISDFGAFMCSAAEPIRRPIDRRSMLLSGDLHKIFVERHRGTGVIQIVNLRDNLRDKPVDGDDSDDGAIVELGTPKKRKLRRSTPKKNVKSAIPKEKKCASSVKKTRADVASKSNPRYTSARLAHGLKSESNTHGQPLDTAGLDVVSSEPLPNVLPLAVDRSGAFGPAILVTPIVSVSTFSQLARAPNPFAQLTSTEKGTSSMALDFFFLSLSPSCPPVDASTVVDHGTASFRAKDNQPPGDLGATGPKLCAETGDSSTPPSVVEKASAVVDLALASASLDTPMEVDAVTAMTRGKDIPTAELVNLEKGGDNSTAMADDATGIIKEKDASATEAMTLEKDAASPAIVDDTAGVNTQGGETLDGDAAVAMKRNVAAVEYIISRLGAAPLVTLKPTAFPGHDTTKKTVK